MIILKVNRLISGVYEIKNTLNNHRYIGSSVNIYSRWEEHNRDLEKDDHHSAYLQNAWNKYGKDKFEFNILERCDPVKDTLLFIEQKYLDLNPEYNICKFACSSLGFRHSDETKQKLSEIRSGKKPHPNSVKALVESNKNRIWTEEDRQESSKRAEKMKHVIGWRKSVFMLDKITNEVLNEFESIVSAAKWIDSKKCASAISKCCLEKAPSAHGYNWKFKENN